MGLVFGDVFIWRSCHYFVIKCCICITTEERTLIINVYCVVIVSNLDKEQAIDNYFPYFSLIIRLEFLN